MIPFSTFFLPPTLMFGAPCCDRRVGRWWQEWDGVATAFLRTVYWRALPGISRGSLPSTISKKDCGRKCDIEFEDSMLHDRFKIRRLRRDALQENKKKVSNQPENAGKMGLCVWKAHLPRFTSICHSVWGSGCSSRIENAESAPTAEQSDTPPRPRKTKSSEFGILPLPT